MWNRKRQRFSRLLRGRVRSGRAANTPDQWVRGYIELGTQIDGQVAASVSSLLAAIAVLAFVPRPFHRGGRLAWNAGH